MAGHPNSDRQIQDIWDALEQWQPEPISLDFNRRLYSRIDAANENRRTRTRLWSSIGTLLVAAIAMAAALHSSSGNPPPPVTPAASNRVEVEKVVQTLSDLDMLKQIDRTRSL